MPNVIHHPHNRNLSCYFSVPPYEGYRLQNSTDFMSNLRIPGINSNPPPHYYYTQTVDLLLGDSFSGVVRLYIGTLAEFWSHVAMHNWRVPLHSPTEKNPNRKIRRNPNTDLTAREIFQHNLLWEYRHLNVDVSKITDHFEAVLVQRKKGLKDG